VVEGEVALVFATTELRFASPGKADTVSTLRYGAYVKREDNGACSHCRCRRELSGAVGGEDSRPMQRAEMSARRKGADFVRKIVLLTTEARRTRDTECAATDSGGEPLMNTIWTRMDRSLNAVRIRSLRVPVTDFGFDLRCRTQESATSPSSRSRAKLL